MENLSVIVPTITGREDWVRKTIRAYEKRARGCQIIVIKDEPSCGHAWAKGARKATGDYIHFTADDIIPRSGWLKAAVATVDAGAMPAANVRDQNDNALSCDAPLGDMIAGPNILVPFFSRKQFDMGDWILPCHYGTDDWITYLARKRGIPVKFVDRYLFRHGIAQEGRDYSRRGADVAVLVEAMQKEGYVPPAYASLLHDLLGCPDACCVIAGNPEAVPAAEKPVHIVTSK